jgi:hydroxylamine reductase
MTARIQKLILEPIQIGLQKAVCILLTLLYLGIKNILLGPSLPAFISPNVLQFLVENYNIAPISTPEEDLKKLLA